MKSLFKASLVRNEPYYKTLEEYHSFFIPITFLRLNSEVFFEDLSHKKVSFLKYPRGIP